MGVRRALLFAALFLMACAPSSLPAPSGGAAKPAEERDPNQVLRIAVQGMVGNPTPQASSFNHPIYWAMYDNLTQLSGEYEVKPSIAQKWEINADGKIWKFTIRTDMKWPNGDALTARDVAFTFQTILERNWPQRSQIANVTEARVIDDATVEVVSRQADMTLPAAANFLWIIPKAYYESVGFDGYRAKPMGSGPYEMIEFKDTDFIHYRKRAAPHAFRSPIATEVIFKSIAEDSQIINGLQTGELDIASSLTLSGDHVERAKRADLQIITTLARYVYLLAPQGSFEIRDTPLKDRRVRYAIRYAINNEAIVNGLFKGFAKATGELAVPGSLYSDPTVKPWPYDPAMAKRLLAEAGYPNGFSLSGGLDYSTATSNRDSILAIQSDLRAIGIVFDVIANEQGVYVDKAYGRNSLARGDFWVGRSGDNIGFGESRTFIGCGKPVGGRKEALTWCNEEFDRLMDAGYAEPDLKKRSDLLRQANKIQRDEAVYMAMYLDPAFTIHTGKVRSVEIQHVLYHKFDSAYRVK